MDKRFKIKNKLTDTLVDAKLISLNESNLNEFLEFQEKILDAIDDKDIYVPTSKEEYLDYMNYPYYIVGVKTLDENKLIAVGIYVNIGLNPHNYGYDLEYSDSDILKTSQIQSVLVLPQFRGNKLQILICEKLVDIAINNGDKFITATVAPTNPYSLNSFLKLGFTNEKEKLKYGGLRRYILSKKL